MSNIVLKFPVYEMETGNFTVWNGIYPGIPVYATNFRIIPFPKWIFFSGKMETLFTTLFVIDFNCLRGKLIASGGNKQDTKKQLFEYESVSSGKLHLLLRKWRWQSYNGGKRGLQLINFVSDNDSTNDY